MKILFGTIVLVFIFQLQARCQSDVTKVSAEATKKLTRRMDFIVSTIDSMYAKDSLFLSNFKESQRLWVLWFRAQINMMYPNYPDEVASDRSLCVTTYARQLLSVRIKELKLWTLKEQINEPCPTSIRRHLEP